VITLLRSLLILALLLIPVHRLPAPIFEVATPTPTATPKPKPKPENVERTTTQPAQTKAKQSPFAAFAGVWTGSATGGLNFSNGLNVSDVASPVTFRISKDGTIYQGPSVLRTSASPDGRALTWTYQYNDSNGSGHGTASLRLIAPNTASYQVNIILTLTSGGNGTMKSSGTLSKQ
jgi:hypothetical protein